MTEMDPDYLADSTARVACEVVDERVRAHAKHRDHSMESWPALSTERYLILAEEVGEVAKEFNDAKVESRPIDRGALRTELLQVATMAVAWVAALDAERPECICYSTRSSRCGAHENEGPGRG